MSNLAHSPTKGNGVATSLAEIANRINEAHVNAEQSVRRGLAFAIEAGRLLAEVKETVGHGRFLSWIAGNCRFAPRTAQVYLRLARHADELMEPNAQNSAHLSIHRAMESLGVGATSALSPSDEFLLKTVTYLDARAHATWRGHYSCWGEYCEAVIGGTAAEVDPILNMMQQVLDWEGDAR